MHESPSTTHATGERGRERGRGSGGGREGRGREGGMEGREGGREGILKQLHAQACSSLYMRLLLSTCIVTCKSLLTLSRINFTNVHLLTKKDASHI